MCGDILSQKGKFFNFILPPLSFILFNAPGGHQSWRELIRAQPEANYRA
jgi:hypothetical protein